MALTTSDEVFSNKNTAQNIIKNLENNSKRADEIKVSLRNDLIESFASDASLRVKDFYWESNKKTQLQNQLIA